MKKIRGLDTETIGGKAFIFQTRDQVYRIKRFEDFTKYLRASGFSNFAFFNIDYDVSAILRHVPEKVAGELYVEKQVLYRGYKMRYLPGKFFRISFNGKRYNFYDIYPFFQCSLDHAGEKFLQRRKQSISKELLSNLTLELYEKHQAKIDRYAKQDAALTEDLALLLLAAFAKAGIKHRHLYSPGNIAKGFWRQTGIKDRAPTGKALEIIQEGYYGAHIEVLKRGNFPTARILDIKSAYPYGLSQIPDFSQAEYRISDRIESTYFYARVRAWCNDYKCHLLPFRIDNLLVFPKFTGQTTVITNFEYDVFTKHNLGKLEVLEVVNIFVKPEFPYKPHVERIFNGRADGALESLAYKLVLNSSYGVKAEKIKSFIRLNLMRGYKQRLRTFYNVMQDQFRVLLGRNCKHSLRYWENVCKCQYCKAARGRSRNVTQPTKTLLEYGKDYYLSVERAGKVSNLAIAGMITAITRCQLWEKGFEIGFESVIGMFTDSLLCTEKVAPTGKQLGDWELKYDGRIVVIGSGVYQTDDETKMRGYVWKRKLTTLLRKSKSAIITIQQNTRMSIGKIIRQRVKTYEFNEIFEDEKFLNVNFDRKRVWQREFKSGQEVLRCQHDSEPLTL